LRRYVAHEKALGHGGFRMRHIGGGTEVAAIVAGADEPNYRKLSFLDL
jgi:hypothetical protein